MAWEKKDKVQAITYLNEAKAEINKALTYKKKDNFHQAVCKDTLAKIFLLQAEIESDKKERETLLKDALENSEKAISLLKDVAHNRLGKFYNTLGSVHLALNEENNFKTIETCFEDAIL